MTKKQIPQTDAEAVAAFEDEGLTTSDAQAAADAQGAGKRGPRQRLVKRAEKAVTDRGPCVCGCGGFPKGKNARFLPGHDARWHSAQKRGGSEVRLAVAAVVGAEATEERQHLLEDHREVGRVAGQREGQDDDGSEDREERDLRECETPSGWPTAGRGTGHFAPVCGQQKGLAP